MLRSSVPKKAGTHHRSNSQRGQNSFNEDHDQENFELSSKGFRNSHIIGKSDNTRGGFVPKGSAATKFHEKKHHKGREVDDENELSSLSGFTASDNEEHEDDLKFKMYHKSTKKHIRNVSDDDEENLDQEHRDIVLNPKDDLKARFAQLEMIKRKNEEEKRQREILGERDLNEDDDEENPAPAAMKRPQSSYGAQRGGSENMNKMNMTTGFNMPRQKENMRPQTANVENMRIQPEDNFERTRANVTFKPIYTKSINQTLAEKKVFNYSDKRFKTLPKKSDPVSRFNAFKSGWSKSKFLKNTGGNDNKKEGRKLNLSERNQASKPDFIFHKYQPKYVFDV